jgi:phosphate-selective porin OprO/OprP
LFFLTPNKDWRIHVGGRFQFNAVWWQQPEGLQGPPPGNGGVPAQGPGGGVGPLDDGTYFRRVRLRADGVGYELVEFTQEIDFENLNQIAFDHLWVGFKDLPYLGTLRVGQHKVPQGLDMMGSDYYLTFLERSALSDAFWTLFAPGVFLSNTYFDQNVTAQTMFHRVQPLNVYNGAAFGDGDYASTSRATWTPVYAHDGRCVVHLGGSYQWRHANLGRTIGGTGNAFADTQDVVRFRSRPEFRDGVGIGTVVGGSAARFVDTGFLLAENVQTLGPEFMTTWGPLNFRSEAAFSFVENVRSIYPQAAFNVPRGDPTFWGGYVQVSYFLTGEHWGYDRRFGTYDRPKVNESFFLVRGEDGGFHHGLGAWEIAYRFSYLDLNDNGINGGQLNEHTVGLNWYVNDNFRLQANYLNVQRNVAAPANSGTVHGFGTQVQWYF